MTSLPVSGGTHDWQQSYAFHQSSWKTATEQPQGWRVDTEARAHLFQSTGGRGSKWSEGEEHDSRVMQFIWSDSHWPNHAPLDQHEKLSRHVILLSLSVRVLFQWDTRIERWGESSNPSEYSDFPLCSQHLSKLFLDCVLLRTNCFITDCLALI